MAETGTRNRNTSCKGKARCANVLSILSHIGIGSHVALQHPHTEMWSAVVDIDPYPFYFVKTQSDCVLT